MEEKCLCKASEVLIFPCSGASNWGQISNEVALMLRDDGEGTPYCTAGIGGHVKPLVDTARQAKALIAIDGCPMMCVKKCLEGEGFQPTLHIVISEELGSDAKKTYKRPDEKHIRKAYNCVLPKVKDVKLVSS